MDGIYSYAGLMALLEKTQGLMMEDVIESLCERLTLEMVRDAKKQGVDLVQTQVLVRRTGYVRVRSSHGLTSWFD